MDLSAPNKPCIGNPPFLPDIPHKIMKARTIAVSNLKPKELENEKQWIIACLIGIQGVNVQAQQPSKYPYQDTKLTAEQRADDLLQRLTLEEKWR